MSLLFPLQPRFTWLAAALLALAGLASPAAAQWGPPAVVSVQAAVEPTEIRPGGEVTLRITATVDEGYHLYSIVQPPAPPGKEFGPIPTEINLDEATSGLISPRSTWAEPEITVKFDKGFERDVGYLYGSPLEFTRTFRLSPDAQPGTINLAGGIYHQACTETSCLPPATVDWTASLTVLEGDPIELADPAPAPSDTGATVTGAAAAVDSAAGQSDSERVVGESTFLGFLGLAFFLGILALATPCVFPMIPITISFFSNKAAKSTFEAAKLSGVYVGSIILGFTAIGFGFSILLYLLGGGVENSGFANWIAANPWVNLFFAVLYIAFALSLFEVFVIQPPAWMTSGLQKRAGGGSDLLGIAAKAIVFVIISFTCTAPLLGVLIVQALTGEWTRPLFGMMAFATGFAAPFFLLAMVPQLMGRMPRSGAWLYSVKVVMGLLVLAAAFKFLSNADLILLGQSMVLTREVLLAIWAMIGLVITFYLFGMIRLPDDPETNSIGVSRLLLGTTFGSFALYLAAGLFGRDLHGFIEAYMPPDLRPQARASAFADADPLDRLQWHSEIEPALAQARAEGRNVFIDFTGYTCTNCRLMEKNMFPRPAVVERLEQYVLVKLYTDDPEKGRERQAYQAENFNTVALPFYVVITPDEEVIAKAEYTTDESAFVAFLDKGLRPAGPSPAAVGG